MKKPTLPLKIFHACSEDTIDKKLWVKLRNHLSPLKNADLVTNWSSNDILPGSDRNYEISKLLNRAQIILFLISPEFFASETCQSIQQSALQRHANRDAQVIRVNLRPVSYEAEALVKLPHFPT